MILSVVIQAGGESRRMGRDKALLPFLGAPMIQRVRDRLERLGDEMIVTSNRPRDLAFLGLSCFPDPLPGRGTLGGLHAALFHARHPLVAVVACDMPFADPAIFRLALDQISGADAVVPAGRKGLEPLHALYRRETCLPAIREALEAGERRVDAWLRTVRLRTLEPEAWLPLDPDGSAFINVNTPEDLAAAEARARAL